MSATARLVGSLVLAILCCQQDSFAQSFNQSDLENAEYALSIGNPFPAQFGQATVDGSDFLEATVVVEDKVASVSWAPFFLTERYIPVISESRIKIGTKDRNTTLGLSLKWNPFNPRGPRGLSIRPTGIDPTQQDALIENKRFRLEVLKEQAFEEITRGKSSTCPNTLGFLQQKLPADPTARLSSSDLADLKCALVRASAKIADFDTRISAATDPARRKSLNAEKAPWVKAFNDGSAYAEREYIRRHDEAERNYYGRRKVSTLESIRANIAALTAEIEAAASKRAAALFLDFRKQLFSGFVPVVNLSHVTTFFEVIGGGNFDGDGDGNNDNEHNVKSSSLSLSAHWRFSERNQISLLVSQSEERASAAAGQPKADYNGLGATWIYRLTILNRDGYMKTKDYKESLFVPSINAGVSFEEKKCDSPDADCIDGILRTRSITPFVEFKINKKAQFRIGVPFKRSRNLIAGVDGDEDSIEVRALFAFQLGKPK